MSNNRTLVILAPVLAIIAVFVAVYLYNENKKANAVINDLEEDRLKLIHDSLKNNNISNEVTTQVEKLIDKYQHIDSRVSNELAQALQLLQIGQPENAIEDLVKIIEHLLKTYYQNDTGFNAFCKEKKKNASRPHLHDLLTYCQKDNKINDVEYRFFIAIKEIRNKEDHTLDLQLEDYINVSGIITAIGAITKLSELVYPTNQISN